MEAVDVFRSRLAKLEKEVEAQRYDNGRILLATPIDENKYEMWGQVWAQESLQAISADAGRPVVILDLM